VAKARPRSTDTEVAGPGPSSDQYRVGLVADAQKEQQDDQEQWCAEQPRKNEDHLVPPPY
jgi:hypothetical protein